MKLTTILLLLGLMRVSAATFAQKMTMKQSNASLREIFNQIKMQTGYGVVVKSERLEHTSTINVSFKNQEVTEVLDKILPEYNLDYIITDNTIIIKPATPKPSFIDNLIARFKAIDPKGKIVDSLGIPLVGASVTVKGTNRVVRTNESGDFYIQNVDEKTILIISYLGYESREVKATSDMGSLTLKQQSANLSEVTVNTGYQQLPKERSTGSFSVIDNELLNRSVSTNVIDRLEGVTNSLLFDRRNISEENRLGSSPDLRVRGISTIESNESPLIVIDNFPYEGDINSINPNDIESITVLKDAAAASIWGARAGNGVIVITTKQGRYNQKARITLNSNINIGNKPDLFYNQNFLPATAVMAIEKGLFEKGGSYPEEPQTALPAYVELLIKKRDHVISDAQFLDQQSILEQTDVRNEALNNLYQRSLNQQYALNVNGGGSAYRYYFSAGVDRNKDYVIGNHNQRLNLSLQNTFQPLKGLEFTAGIWFTRQESNNNGITLTDLRTAINTIGNISPYTRFSDENGNTLAIPRELRTAYVDQAVDNGLLDWSFKPLDEVKLADQKNYSTEIRMNGGIKYTFLNDFNVNATYQFVQGQSKDVSYYSPETYFVRNLVNEFTQVDGQKIIPYGGILNGSSPIETTSHSARLQMNYQKQFNASNSLTALAGVEVRQRIAQNSPGYMLYNYNDQLAMGTNVFNYNENYTIRPTGSSLIPGANYNTSYLTDRYLSYFANAAYTLYDRYTLSASTRWDASNIFGVKTNQKGVPLYSIGGSWEISKADFYKSGLIPYLRLRGTIGSNGNVNTNVSTFPTIIYSTEIRTGLPKAPLTSAGNPNLRWEKVNTFNVGLDFAMARNRIEGSIEYYNKKASDLIGLAYMDPTSGIIDGATPFLENKINYANMNTNGIDFQLTSRNFSGKFQWETTMLFSYVRNKITNFNTSKTTEISNYMSYPAPPSAGKSRDVVYALPWYGLDNQTGLPLVYINGEITNDYGAYYNSLTPENLIDEGVSSPPYFGSVRNTFGWKKFLLSATISWKAGYVFRRNSIASGSEYNREYHLDYFKRWKNPGDEQFTNVPAFTNDYDTYRAASYLLSDALITKGDHIRLQDINLSYSFNPKMIKRLGLQSLRVFSYVRNLGIIWRANKNNLDPDYPNANYPAPLTTAFGLQVEF